MQTVDGVCLTLALLAWGVCWFLGPYMRGVAARQRGQERATHKER